MSLLSGEKLAGGGGLQSFFTLKTDTQREEKAPLLSVDISVSVGGWQQRVHGGAKWGDGMNRSRAAGAGAILWTSFFFFFNSPVLAGIYHLPASASCNVLGLQERATGSGTLQAR